MELTDKQMDQLGRIYYTVIGRIGLNNAGFWRHSKPVRLPIDRALSINRLVQIILQTVFTLPSGGQKRQYRNLSSLKEFNDLMKVCNPLLHEFTGQFSLCYCCKEMK